MGQTATFATCKPLTYWILNTVQVCLVWRTVFGFGFGFVVVALVLVAVSRSFFWEASSLFKQFTYNMSTYTMPAMCSARLACYQDCLTLWWLLLPHGYSYKASCVRPGNCNFWHLDVKNYKWQLNLVRHRILYSCTNMAKMGIKGLRTK